MNPKLVYISSHKSICPLLQQVNDMIWNWAGSILVPKIRYVLHMNKILKMFVFIILSLQLCWQVKYLYFKKMSIFQYTDQAVHCCWVFIFFFSSVLCTDLKKCWSISHKQHLWYIYSTRPTLTYACSQTETPITLRDASWILDQIHPATRFMHHCSKHKKCILETSWQGYKTSIGKEHASAPFIHGSLAATRLHVCHIKYESIT